MAAKSEMLFTIENFAICSGSSALLRDFRFAGMSVNDFDATRSLALQV
jgi:hypothetical protein